MNQSQDRSHLPGHLINIPDFMLLDKGFTGSKEFQRNTDEINQAMHAWAENYAVRKQGRHSSDGGDFGHGYNVAYQEWREWENTTNQNIKICVENYSKVVDFNSDLIKQLEDAHNQIESLKEQKKVMRRKWQWTEMILAACVGTLKRLLTEPKIRNYVAWAFADRYAIVMNWTRDSRAGVSEGITIPPNICPEYLSLDNNDGAFINECIAIADEIKNGRLHMTIGDDHVQYQGINPLPTTLIPEAEQN